MPYYTFKCSKCSEEVTLLQSFNTEAPKCEDCSKNMEKQFRPSGDFKLMGRNWSYDGYDKNKSLRKGNPKFNDFDS